MLATLLSSSIMPVIGLGAIAVGCLLVGLWLIGKSAKFVRQAAK